jgi:hypothetical protein
VKPKRAEAPPKRKPPVERVVVERKRPADPGIPPEAIMQGIGLGIGIAGGLSHGGGGGGPAPSGHQH